MISAESRWISDKARFLLSCYGLLLLPIGILTVFFYFPVAWAFVGSLHSFEVGGTSRFIGLDNYEEFFFRDPLTYVSFLHMLLLTVFMVCIRLTIPLVVAKLIYALVSERARHTYRIVFLIPIVVPGVAIQLIWSGMIYNDAGMINEAIRAIGDFLHFGPETIEGVTRGWLSDPKTALVAVACVGFPWVGGIGVLIYYAGLASIPTSVNESAKLEGCTGISKFFRIDIPMVLSQLKLILVLTLITGVQSYENIFILTQGGPGFKTMVPGLWMYLNAFSFQRMGYACAIGVCLFVIIFGLTVVTFRYFKSTEELEGRA